MIIVCMSAERTFLPDILFGFTSGSFSSNTVFPEHYTYISVCADDIVTIGSCQNEVEMRNRRRPNKSRPRIGKISSGVYRKERRSRFTNRSRICLPAINKLRVSSKYYWYDAHSNSERIHPETKDIVHWRNCLNRNCYRECQKNTSLYYSFFP